MANQQYKTKQQVAQQHERQLNNTSDERHLLKCPRCGAAYDEGDKFCPYCGEELGRHCMHCGAKISDTCEICPVCGRPTDEHHCPFCGEAYDDDAPFCAECGSPRSGIKCPTCGTLSFRSFCMRCNTPLNDNALYAVQEAQKDPKVKRAIALQEEIEELEKYLLEYKTEIEQLMAEEASYNDAPDAPGLSAEGEKLQTQYAELLKLLGKKAAVQSNPKTVERPTAQKRRALKLKYVDLDKVLKEYEQKQNEMQDVLSAMLPDANSTPAQQRDYACARKVAMVTKQTVITKEKHRWECNFCHCMHTHPSECMEPWHGGTWHYKNIKKEVETKTWNYLD